MTKQASTVTGTVQHIQRHGHTYYGNPMMTLMLEVTAIDGTPAESASLVSIRVSNNAALVYEIGNAEYRETPHTFAITKAGRISHIVKGA